MGYSHHLILHKHQSSFIIHHSSRTRSHNHLILVPSWAELGVAGETDQIVRRHRGNTTAAAQRNKENRRRRDKIQQEHIHRPSPIVTPIQNGDRSSSSSSSFAPSSSSFFRPMVWTNHHHLLPLLPLFLRHDNRSHFLQERSRRSPGWRGDGGLHRSPHAITSIYTSSTGRTTAITTARPDAGPSCGRRFPGSHSGLC